MKKFEDQNDSGMYITENQAQIYLTPYEANELWQWLFARKDTFHVDSSAKQLIIHLYQGNLSHLDDLKTAIPDQHEHEPFIKALDPGRDPVTGRALQLHKEFQLQYHVHPLLDDDDTTYAQG